MNGNNKKTVIILTIIFVCFILLYISVKGGTEKIIDDIYSSNNRFSIIASSENKELEDVLYSYAEQNGIKLSIDYAGTIEIMEKLNNGEKYDAVWTSNSIWLYMLDSSKVNVTNSKSISINPVVFGITESKARELGFIGKEVYTKDIIQAITEGKLKFNMSSATQTNTGATAYLGFVATLAGNPEVLTLENLENEELKTNLINLLSGVERSSGSEEFLENMYLNGNYEAVVTYESSIININKKLEGTNKEPLYAIYPVDGVALSDSPFAYINNKNEAKLEEFEKIQNYLLSKEGQDKLEKYGRRVWYGGISENADKSIFNPNWGIDTTKYVVPVKYPSTTVIKKALGIYQTELRKPIHTVFCLDYSGSMYGSGEKQLEQAMKYILTEEEASKNLLQFAEKDKITVIPFNSKVIKKWQVANGLQTSELIDKINAMLPTGGTNIYSASIEALNTLKDESSDYNLSIILMTDGMSNAGSLKQLKEVYNQVGKDIPIYSIMFGEADSSELEDIALLTNAKVFDGRTNLLDAFKQVRGYN